MEKAPQALTSAMEHATVPTPAQRGRLALLAIVVLGFLLVPIVMGRSVADVWKPSETWRSLLRALSLFLTLAAVVACWRRFPLPVSGRQRSLVCLLALLFSSWMTDLHYSNVDLGKYFAHYQDNVAWQIDLQRQVLERNPEALPHSYRFLPNVLVDEMQLLTGNYLLASLLYRFLVNFLLILTSYALAREFLDHQQALFALLLMLLAYPFSIRYYAGQLTDPLSHLSFFAGILFLFRGWRFEFALTQGFGVLAKESVIVLSAFAVCCWPLDRTRRRYDVLLFLAVLLEILAVRWWVAKGLSYESVSGVGPAHIVTNLLAVWDWGRQLAHTVGIPLLLALLGWRSAPAFLRRLVLFLLPTLLLSSLLFSYLKESRNYMPVVLPLAIIATPPLLARHSNE